MAGKLVMLRPVVGQLDTRTARQLPTALGFGDARRGSSTARGYGWEWQQLRLPILRRDGYVCQVCAARGIATPAVAVDHVINKAWWRAQYGSLDGCDEPSNLQSICKDCHDLKTQGEARGGPGADLAPTR